MTDNNDKEEEEQEATDLQESATTAWDVDAFIGVEVSHDNNIDSVNKDVEKAANSTTIKLRREPSVLSLRHPSMWSISYEQLVNEDYGVAGMAQKLFGANYGKITMRDVHAKIIVPKCQETGKSFALSLNPNGLVMDAFVTHCWDEPFRDFIDTIKTSFLPYVTKPNLWICAFALQQGNAAALQQQLEVPLEESPFVLALKHANLYVVVRNAKTDLYSRIWCVCELLFAKRFGLTAAAASGKQKSNDNDSSSSMRQSQTTTNNNKTTWVIGPDAFSHERTSCRDAQAYSAADKQKILLALEQDIQEIDELVLQYRAHASHQMLLQQQQSKQLTNKWTMMIVVGACGFLVVMAIVLVALFVTQPWKESDNNKNNQKCMTTFNNDELTCSILMNGVDATNPLVTSDCDCLNFCDGALASCVTFADSDNMPKASCPGQPGTSPNVVGCLATTKTAKLEFDVSQLPSSTLFALTKSATPQSAAYQWLLQHPDLDQMSDARKLQLFALASLYHSTSQKQNWHQDALEQWLDYDTNECHWTTEYVNATAHVWDFGADCDEDGHYQSIDLDNDGLNGPLPPELFLLSRLSYLTLFNNTLTSDIPTEIGTLTRLTHLDLHSNHFQGTIPTELGLLTALTYLGLWRNSLQGTFPSELGLLTALTTLSVHNNNMNGRLPSSIANLRQIKTLYFYDAGLSGTIPASLCNYTKEWSGGITVDKDGGLIDCPCNKTICHKV